MAEAASKQNGSRVLVLDKKGETMKFIEHIIIMSNLMNRQQITCSRRNSKDIEKTQFLRVVCKKRGPTSM
jgi:hypothetical protein